MNFYAFFVIISLYLNWFGYVLKYAIIHVDLVILDDVGLVLYMDLILSCIDHEHDLCYCDP